MTITLKIIDRDRLPDGGPIEFTAGPHGFDIGREQHLDWCLPDPDRYVSGHHARVRYQDETYWLEDISTNGTYVNGSDMRVRSPYRLMDGDRLQIGNYQVAVAITRGVGAAATSAPGGQQAAPAPETPFDPSPQPHAAPGQVHDIWATPLAAAPPPVDRRWFNQPAATGRGYVQPDALNQFIDLPQQPPAPLDELKPIPVSLGDLPSSSISEHGPAPQHNSATGSAPNTDELLEVLCAAAGLKPGSLAGREPKEVAREIGLVLRTATEQVAALLQGRASAKRITRSANRTMIGAADNNPLKFSANASEALEIMLQRNRAGYLGAPDSFREAFDDIHTHEKATFAAMQAALARLTEDLTPESVEEKVSGGFGSAKAKAWDIYVQRWNAKTEHLENGVLDVFFGYFSEIYDGMTKKTD